MGSLSQKAVKRSTIRRAHRHQNCCHLIVLSSYTETEARRGEALGLSNKCTRKCSALLLCPAVSLVLPTHCRSQVTVAELCSKVTCSCYSTLLFSPPIVSSPIRCKNCNSNRVLALTHSLNTLLVMVLDVSGIGHWKSSRAVPHSDRTRRTVVYVSPFALRSATPSRFDSTRLRLDFCAAIGSYYSLLFVLCPTPPPPLNRLVLDSHWPPAEANRTLLHSPPLCSVCVDSP